MLIQVGKISNYQDEYYQWLLDIVNPKKEEYDYFFLCKALYKKGFRWRVPNDDNRVFEGMVLRQKFCEEIGQPYEYVRTIHDVFKQPVSVLETLIALAIRCKELVSASMDDANIEGWFWRLISNLGLDKFTDEDYFDFGGPPEVDLILENLLERRYKRTGEGGLFPIKNTKKDQRKVEIWYQMSEYLVKNYYIR